MLACLGFLVQKEIKVKRVIQDYQGSMGFLEKMDFLVRKEYKDKKVKESREMLVTKEILVLLE